MSKNVPTNKELYARVKSEAKKKFDRWPSAYGSAWLVKEYKRRGGGYRKAENGMEIPNYLVTPIQQIEMLSDEQYMVNPFEEDQFAAGGGIPERYKNMGFNKVGVKKKSTRPGKKWMVLAKKGDKYKVVHGGDSKMQDFTQHRSKDRQKKFWDRMGGRDSAKAKDPFSPLYWHKRFGTWAEGGETFNEDSMDFYAQGGGIDNAGFRALPPEVQEKIKANMAMGGDLYRMGGQPCYMCGGTHMKDGGWIKEATDRMEEKGTVGAFTKQAKRAGYDSVQSFASHVLNNKGKFSGTTVKRAQFAKNMGNIAKAQGGMQVSSTSGMGNIAMQDQMTMGDVFGNEPMINLPIKAPAQIWDFNQPLPSLQIQPSFNPVAPELEQQSRNLSWMRPVANGVLGLAGAYARGVENRRRQEEYAPMTAADNVFAMTQQGMPGDRGDYDANTGFFRPDEMGFKNDARYWNPYVAQASIYREEGGQIGMVDEKLLKELIAAGADIEFLD